MIGAHKPAILKCMAVAMPPASGAVAHMRTFELLMLHNRFLYLGLSRFDFRFGMVERWHT